MKQRSLDILLKFSALLMPFTMVYYPELHDTNRKEFGISLWKYIITGFCMYFIFAILYILLKF